MSTRPSDDGHETDPDEVALDIHTLRHEPFGPCRPSSYEEATTIAPDRFPFTQPGFPERPLSLSEHASLAGPAHGRFQRHVLPFGSEQGEVSGLTEHGRSRPSSPRLNYAIVSIRSYPTTLVSTDLRLLRDSISWRFRAVV